MNQLQILLIENGHFMGQAAFFILLHFINCVVYFGG